MKLRRLLYKRSEKNKLKLRLGYFVILTMDDNYNFIDNPTPN